MTAVVTRNPRMGRACIAPHKDDGTMYRYSMFFDGNDSIAYADTTDDLLATLIEGYATLDAQAQIEARIMLAVTMQVHAQAYINADSENADAIAAMTEAERGVLNGPRHIQPHGWTGGEDPDMGDFWDSTVPLVLVETGYAPYTKLNRPISGFGDVMDPENIIWLRPQDEWEFLVSLHRAGRIMLTEANNL